ncbi:Protein BcsX [Gluconacetobacter sp. SXCC-1]|uniref:SGNH/GDSL hydrolase family protein n=1 Tax=Komagataeibacter rhaeticus TaxID=215221 RepID=A0A181C8X1_9PROT|nr:SGNH/GDSL hydrolase family protein [Komagataeibacter rhaeticus]ATU72171.1 SGNH/GDSL hydrolase family protein [Komagataeibacter xylinus]EGG75174.1 Protein BcsX [Gluconacetobacter sp. SXCC-1]QIP34890.1 SGNH/GDSL hydrolase family protein [Komagataeibacter rhaeticus]QOC47423.1 SGNH/GDSL hydrolase family protein [Komagataeibacter rhaeticus]WPP21885.1 SGNH/GDSL hydrolase family protein [Komagataeibacter rhaeticus]
MNALLAGLTLLIIGDSHVTFKDTLLSVLPDEFTRQGARVVTYGVCSSTAADWVVPNPNNGCGAAERIGTAPIGAPDMKPASPPPVAELIAKWHPDAVMVILGDTMAAYGQGAVSKDWVDEQVKSLTYTIGRTACIWVGPTWGQFSPRYGKTDQRAMEMASFLKGEVAPCTYIDGTALLRQGSVSTTDGIHATPESYRVWGNAIVQAALPELEKLKSPAAAGQ